MEGFEVRDIHRKGLALIEQGCSLFITGKAGTGKTMYLKYIIESLKDKKTIVTLSPTGVAARNACGFTIHSFLRLPLGPYIPNMKKYGLYNLNESKDGPLIRSLDIMIIDEISMVRCDLLDEVDDVLRHYRKNNKPFGGVQLILFGDLYQLMPVAKEEEVEQLGEYYETLNFYSSKAFQKLDCRLLELRKVYRQNDTEFVNILNNVRVGRNKTKVLSRLRLRYSKGFEPKDDEGYIRLTTHNWRARKYNNDKLESLPTKEYEYKAWIDQYFPKHEFPTDYVLRLKLGTRVMFIRNDNQNYQYVNGTLGTVTYIDNDSIRVKVDDTDQNVWVEKQKWDFYRYRINRTTKEIYQELIGSYVQYPLKHAWAVTIHKSQGLTFDKVIVDAGKAFAEGQVYVALSRCTDLQGVVLVSEITPDNIKISNDVVSFLESAHRVNVADEEMDYEEMLQENERKQINEFQNSALEKTLWYVNDGLSIEEIVKRSGERIEIIYSHLSKLIERGFVDVHDYITDEKYNHIRNVVNRVGIESHLKDIKDSCKINVRIGEITMVISSIKHGDPEVYAHKAQTTKQQTNKKKDFFGEMPVITKGANDSQRPVKQKVILRKATKDDITSSTKIHTIFASGNESKSKDDSLKYYERKIIEAANKAKGHRKPKYVVNYHAISNIFGKDHFAVVSARDGYYLRTESGKYFFLTELKKQEAAGSMYASTNNSDPTTHIITHSDFNGNEVVVGSIKIQGRIFTFTDANGEHYTLQID